MIQRNKHSRKVLPTEITIVLPGLGALLFFSQLRAKREKYLILY